MKVLTLTETQDVARTAASGSFVRLRRKRFAQTRHLHGFLGRTLLLWGRLRKPDAHAGGSAEPVLKARTTRRRALFREGFGFSDSLNHSDSRSLNWLMSVDSAQGVRLLASRALTGLQEEKESCGAFVSRVAVHLRPARQERVPGGRRLEVCAPAARPS